MRIKFQFSNLFFFGMSFTYNKNNSRLQGLPWGTTATMPRDSEVALSYIEFSVLKRILLYVLILLVCLA